MGYIIQRTDGSTDGLGDRIVFASEAEAWEAARTAFGADPASADGVESWLCVVPTDEALYGIVYGCGYTCGDFQVDGGYESIEAARAAYDGSRRRRHGSGCGGGVLEGAEIVELDSTGAPCATVEVLAHDEPIADEA